MIQNVKIKKLLKKIAQSTGYEIGKVDRISRHIQAFPDMKRLCARIEQPIIFDVGAHHGETAMKFRRYFSDARIFSFEPFRKSFETLVSTTSGDKLISAFNYGLANQDMISSFHSNNKSGTNSILATDDRYSEFWGEGLLQTKTIVQAEFKTVDTVLSKLGISHIDILKMDVQGAENLVLEGAFETCKDANIGIVYSEIITQPTYVGQQRFDEALTTFYNNGFNLYNIYNFGWSPNGCLRKIDVIFTRNIPAD